MIQLSEIGELVCFADHERTRNDPEAAITGYRIILRKLEDAPNPAIEATVRHMLAVMLFRVGETDEAHDNLERILFGRPKLVLGDTERGIAMCDLARVMIVNGKYLEAENLLARAYEDLGAAKAPAEEIGEVLHLRSLTSFRRKFPHWARLFSDAALRAFEQSDATDRTYEIGHAIWRAKLDVYTSEGSFAVRASVAHAAELLDPDTDDTPNHRQLKAILKYRTDPTGLHIALSQLK